MEIFLLKEENFTDYFNSRKSNAYKGNQKNIYNYL